jgi:chromosomal replication initiator protein
MILVPSLIALYNAHKARVARIDAPAFHPPQIIVPVPEPEIDAAKILADAKFKAWTESERVRKERIKSTWAKKMAEARGPVEVEKPVPFFAELMAEVCKFYDVTSLAMKSSRRDGPIIKPRQVLCYLAYCETALSFPAIGRLIGNRDHTTVLHAVRKIERQLKQDNDEDLTVAVVTIKLRVRDRVEARWQAAHA